MTCIDIYWLNITNSPLLFTVYYFYILLYLSAVWRYIKRSYIVSRLVWIRQCLIKWNTVGRSPVYLVIVAKIPDIRESTFIPTLSFQTHTVRDGKWNIEGILDFYFEIKMNDFLSSFIKNSKFLYQSSVDKT